jgi:hypothetical protein
MKDLIAKAFDKRATSAYVVSNFMSLMTPTRQFR